jgi:hypothetical protein
MELCLSGSLPDAQIWLPSVSRTRESPAGSNVRHVMELVDVASQIVAPAVRAVFKAGEISALKLRATDELEGSVALSLTVQDETFDYLVIQGTVSSMGAEEWSENLRSLLVDFVAESRFGWGENRDLL